MCPTKLAPDATGAAVRPGTGHGDIYRIEFGEWMRAIRHIRALAGIVAIMLAVQMCESRYGPVTKSVSDSRIYRLRRSMTDGEVRAVIGAPSFQWSRKIFSAQGYPKDQTCKLLAPDQMWIYFDLSRGSVCVYFGHDKRVLCVERNDIVVAQ
jgi:hypothetical protein